MKESRISYFIITLTVVIIGIISRKIAFVPFFVGDVFYAVMVYFGIRFLFIHLKKLKSAIIALSICYCIELLQLYDAEWINELRNTLFGHYVLGQGFLWSDILAYTLGIVLASYIEKILFSRR
ncbi:hypothetical protein J2X31_001173 [Flavobacterium arsenatis]|uniref:DUF2809 domain-containing protein n=1 Tax=Flavobacterium arsenatis TaxID=1484332 RepID=A0ABU1TMS6_9FLAO|nr:DUF2809 domain-containing protein [Flavobacterium arsenatis]MDR6967166.1 hypothetical protein [Flavobacterium arsenatis]